MKRKNLTVKNIKQACSKFKYIYLRYGDNSIMGINCKLAFISKFGNEPPEKETMYIGYRPISFSEYIRVKHPFCSARKQ